jgi:hypothetical protein
MNALRVVIPTDYLRGRTAGCIPHEQFIGALVQLQTMVSFRFSLLSFFLSLFFFFFLRKLF